MTFPGRWVSLQLFLVAFIGPAYTQRNDHLFHIPWACSVMYRDTDLIGAGAILSNDKVLVSVDNFNGTVGGSNPPKRYFELINQVLVFAGSNFAFPYKVVRTPSGTATLPLSHYVQRGTARKLYVSLKNPKWIGGAWETKMNPKDISETAGADYDVYGLAFNVGILVLTEPFERSPYVMPMLIAAPNLQERINDFKSNLEASPGSYACVTYSWSQKLNRIRYHEVTYLPEQFCREVFCNWDINHCWQFPKKYYLLCFKAVKYADVCPNARGAALYCPDLDSVLAILTTAPSCGQRHMPGVYTELSMVVDFYKAAFNKELALTGRTTYDLFSLRQKDSDY